jgi:ubiquinone/menaquinone biosynthesis C-methylase UbiE
MASNHGKTPLEPEKSKLEWGAQQAAALWDNLYARYKPAINGKVVLDLGCSWGYMLKFLLERFSPTKLIGVDVSPLWESVEHGWNYAEHSARVEFHAGFLDELEGLAPRSVDYVLCTSVLQYIRPERLQMTLERGYDLLRPGGEMLLRTRCFTSYVGADLHSHYSQDYVHLLNPLRDVHRDLQTWKGVEGRYLNYLTASNYIALFQQAGFEVLDARRRQNLRSPELVEQLKKMFPWVPPDDLLCAELEARLLRPIEAADLPELERPLSTLPTG